MSTNEPDKEIEMPVGAARALIDMLPDEGEHSDHFEALALAIDEAQGLVFSGSQEKATLLITIVT